MIGFELSIKNEIIAAALEKGVVTIVLTLSSRDSEEPMSINFGGLDTSQEKDVELIDWFKSQLEVGDVLTIKVKDIEEISSPIKVRKRERNRDELDLKSYHGLKKRLEEKGLI